MTLADLLDMRTVTGERDEIVPVKLDSSSPIPGWSSVASVVCYH